MRVRVCVSVRACVRACVVFVCMSLILCCAIIELAMNCTPRLVPGKRGLCTCWHQLDFVHLLYRVPRQRHCLTAECDSSLSIYTNNLYTQVFYYIEYVMGNEYKLQKYKAWGFILYNTIVLFHQQSTLWEMCHYSRCKTTVMSLRHLRNKVSFEIPLWWHVVHFIPTLGRASTLFTALYISVGSSKYALDACIFVQCLTCRKHNYYKIRHLIYIWLGGFFLKRRGIAISYILHMTSVNLFPCWESLYKDIVHV